LRVTTVDAERVQLHQLARVVFVQASLRAVVSLADARAGRRWPDRLKVVEVRKHRGMFRRCEHHVFEPSKHIRTDDVALVRSGERRDENLRAGRDAQVIRPEGHESLDKGAIAGDARLECSSRFAC